MLQRLARVSDRGCGCGMHNDDIDDNNHIDQHKHNVDDVNHIDNVDDNHQYNHDFNNVHIDDQHNHGVPDLRNVYLAMVDDYSFVGSAVDGVY